MVVASSMYFIAQLDQLVGKALIWSDEAFWPIERLSTNQKRF